MQDGKNKQVVSAVYRRLSLLLCVGVVLAVILSIVLVYTSINTKQQQYYASTTTGQIIPLQSLDRPVVTNQFILQWASDVTRRIYNINFVNWQQQLAQLQPYFTKQGFAVFMHAMHAGELSAIKQEKLTASAVVSKPPIIVSTGVIKGYFTWLVQLPLLVTYQSASNTEKQHLMATMVVRRASTLTTPHGIQVNSFYTKGMAQ